MTDSLEVTMLPAKEGDCLFIRYGADDDRKAVLIDGGRAWTYKNALKKFLADHGVASLELLVVTHVDRDHIDGILSLVNDADLDLEVKNIWFNTWSHLNGERVVVAQEEEDDLETFGAKMGEELSPLIVDKGWRWNERFTGGAVELADLPLDNVIDVSGLNITLLSPDREKLEVLKQKWKKECELAGITPGALVEDYVVDEDDEIEAFGPINIEELAAEPFESDDSQANGSSIAFILEYGKRKVLLAGDAHADMLETQLRGHGATEDEPLVVDAFKIPHHGSKANISKTLLELLNCQHFLVSTNGNYFKHPDDVAMARIVKFGTAGSMIHFNYKTDHNDYWDNRTWTQQYSYGVEYPKEDSDGFMTVCFEPIE